MPSSISRSLPVSAPSPCVFFESPLSPLIPATNFTKSTCQYNVNGIFSGCTIWGPSRRTRHTFTLRFSMSWHDTCSLTVVGCISYWGEGGGGSCKSWCEMWQMLLGGTNRKHGKYPNFQLDSMLICCQKRKFSKFEVKWATVFSLFILPSSPPPPPAVFCAPNYNFLSCYIARYYEKSSACSWRRKSYMATKLGEGGRMDPSHWYGLSHYDPPPRTKLCPLPKLYPFPGN